MLRKPGRPIKERPTRRKNKQQEGAAVSVSIFPYLDRGKNNAKTGRELCKLLGITSRNLTETIELERRQGHPICASCTAPAKGYYLAECMEEMQDYCRSLARRVGEIEKTRAACERAGELLPQCRK